MVGEGGNCEDWDWDWEGSVMYNDFMLFSQGEKRPICN